MKIEVLHANTYQPKYLRKVARQVCQLVRNSTITERYPRKTAYFTGPDGIQICIRENESEADAVVHVSEDRPGAVTVLVPKRKTLGLSKSFRIPPWLEPACDTSCIGAALPYFGPLYFGQISLSDAARLFKIPDELFGESFINDGYDAGDSDPVNPASLLQLSVTRAAPTPDDTYIDIRGLIAWIMLFEPEAESD
jgi:hypothetical protein